MTVYDAHQSERDITEQLLQALRGLPMIEAQEPVFEPYVGAIDKRLDAELDLVVRDQNYRLLIEVKRSVYPRDVREVLWQIRHLSNRKTDSGIFVFLIAAESMSAGAKDLLREENVGYFDSGGSLYISAPGVYILIDKPPPKTLAKTVRSLFGGKRSQVLHALLLNAGEWFSVKALSELAAVSPATASETLSAMERFDWIKAKGQGPTKERCLTEPASLLDEWAKQARAARQMTFRRYYVPSASPEELVERLHYACESGGVEYVLTQEFAAQRYARFLTSISQVKCRMPPGRAAEEVISMLDARVVKEGANLLIAETKTQGEYLFKQQIGDAWLASPVQVYLDLLRGGGRAKEMADNLREERIGF